MKHTFTIEIETSSEKPSEVTSHIQKESASDQYPKEKICSMSSRGGFDGHIQEMISTVFDHSQSHINSALKK